MKYKDIKYLKENIWLQNNKKCPVLDTEVPLDKCVLDHKHKRKDEEAGPDDKGLIREVLEFRVNAFFGKIENSFKRLGLDKDYDLIEVLRNGADYLERGAYIDESGFKYIHPKEAPNTPVLKKSSYNIIQKLYLKDNKRIPKYSGKLTQALNKIFLKYNVEPEFYSPKSH